MLYKPIYASLLSYRAALSAMSIIPWNTTSCSACSSKNNMSSKMSSSSMYNTGTKAVIDAGRNFLAGLIELPFKITGSTAQGVKGVATNSITGLYDTLKEGIEGSSEVVSKALMADIVDAVKESGMTVGEVPRDALMEVIETAQAGGAIPINAVREILGAVMPQYRLMM